MKNKGKFLAKVTISGKSLNSNGTINPASTDKNGLAAIWVQPLAGEIPNRNTITGTVAQRMGIPMDDNGIIGAGETKGSPHGSRLIFGQWILSSVHEDFGNQYSFTIIQDLTESPNIFKQTIELEEALGEGSIFEVPKKVPADYQRKVEHHDGVAKKEGKSHSANVASEEVPF